MKFINNNEAKKVRSGTTGNYTWTLVNTGDNIEVSAEVGQAYGFTYVEDSEPEEKKKSAPEKTEKKPKATEGKAGNKKVETKQEEKKPKKSGESKK